MKKKYESENKNKRNAYLYDKYHKDIEFKIKISLRNRLGKLIKRDKKSNSTLNLLGCSFSYFIDYLESTFQPDMTWDNYGKWHIDHIIPCAAFDLTDPEQQKMCFNYKNMQALWKMDNLYKKDLLPNGKYASKMNKKDLTLWRDNVIMSLRSKK